MSLGSIVSASSALSYFWSTFLSSSASSDLLLSLFSSAHISLLLLSSFTSGTSSSKKSVLLASSSPLRNFLREKSAKAQGSKVESIMPRYFESCPTPDRKTDACFVSILYSLLINSMGTITGLFGSQGFRLIDISLSVRANVSADNFSTPLRAAIHPSTDVTLPGNTILRN